MLIRPHAVTSKAVVMETVIGHFQLQSPRGVLGSVADDHTRVRMDVPVVSTFKEPPIGHSM
eukprot:53870-Eustigmatos_ZCMA.PRE.1